MRQHHTSWHHRRLVALLILSLALSIPASIINAQQPSAITLQPSASAVSIGDEVTLTVVLSPAEAIGGWLLSLSFDPALLQATTVTPGSFWTEMFDDGDINNHDGTITDIQTWSTGPYPSEEHTLCTIGFTAVQAGDCPLTITQAEVTDTMFTDLAVLFHNTTIVILPQNQGQTPPPGGTLKDTDDDGVYDTFVNETTGNQTGVEQQPDGSYLIDMDGDGIGDYVYDPETNNKGTLTAETPLLPIIGAIVLCGIVLLCVTILYRRRSKKPKK